MINKIIEKLKGLSAQTETVDPACFNDPLAGKTDWNPLKRGGANFCTHRLVQIDAMRMEFRATLMAKIVYGLFFAIGLGVLIVALYPQVQKGYATFDMELFLPVLLGAVFTVIGGTLLYSGNRLIVFDQRRGLFWKGRKAPDIYRPGAKTFSIASFNDIHAIQIISEFCRGNKNSYYSYELNLVLENAGRVNVVDHGSIDKLRQDAGKLAQFLGKPVWDATAE